MLATILARLFRKSKQHTVSRKRDRRFLPTFETLEDRIVPSTGQDSLVFVQPPPSQITAGLVI